MKRFSLLGASFLWAIACQAGPIIGNIATPVGGIASVSGTTAVGTGFKMNAGTNYSLDAVKVMLTNSGTAITGSELNLGIFADSAGLPSGSALTTLSIGVTISSGAQITYTATPGSAFTLLANTSYWLVLNDPNSSRLVSWDTASGNVFATGTGATDQGVDSGTMSSPTQIGTFAKAVLPPMMYEIDGTAVVTSPTPEPSSFVLAGLGLAAAAMRRRLC